MNPQQEELHAIKPANQLTVAELQSVCHQRSHAAGWWDDYIAMPERFRKYFLASRYALIHSEATEAFEGLRKTRMDDHLPRRKGEEVELADLLIRVFDYAGAMQFDLAGAIAEKLAYNAQRHDHTLEARAAEGGKKL